MRSIRKLAVVVAYSGLLLMLGYVAGSRAAKAPTTAHKLSASVPAPTGATAVKPDAAIPMQGSGPSLTTELTDWPNLTPEN